MDLIARRYAWCYALSQLKLKYRYTLLGACWNVLEPGLYLGVLSMVFSVINRMDIRDYAVFLFGALVPWRYFEKVVTGCTDAVVSGDWLHKKMRVSPATLPVARWIVATAELLFSMVAMFGVFSLLDHHWTIHLVILPVALLPWSMLGLGIGLCTAILFVFFRDIRTLVQLGLMLMFFSSPILFRAGVFSGDPVREWIIRLHPITYFAALLQKPVYQAMWPDAIDWLVSVPCATAALLLGMLAIRRYRHTIYYYL